MHLFSTPWKHKTLRFSDFSGGRESLHWKQMVLYGLFIIEFEQLFVHKDVQSLGKHQELK